MATTANFLGLLESAQAKYFSTRQEISLGSPIDVIVSDAGKRLPAWGTLAREKELYRIMMESNHLSGLAWTALTKLANIPLQFVPYDRTIVSHVERANYFTRVTKAVSEGGEGMRMAMKRFILDYLVTDNGGFMEIMGDGPADGPLIGMPWGMRHLDSLYCRRTGDIRYPVAYIDEDGKRYKLHQARVIYFAQQPLGRRRKQGRGISSVSRSNLLAEVLTGQIMYKLEKMGQRPSTKVFVGDNIPTEKMVSAFLGAKHLQDNLGLEHFGMNVYIGGTGIGMESFDLNNFDPFDEEVGTLMAIYSIAFCWGLKIQDIWPVSGSKASDEISNMQSRGRLPADYMGDMGEAMENKFCPPYLHPVFYEQDEEQEMMQANIGDIRSRRISRLAEYEIIDNAAQRRIMMEDGDLGRSEFVRQQLAEGLLEDGSPIATTFYVDDSLIRGLVELPEVENPLHFEENDPVTTIAQIHTQQALCYEVISERSEARTRKAVQALAALEWLKEEYRSVAMTQMVEQEETDLQDSQDSQNANNANNADDQIDEE